MAPTKLDAAKSSRGLREREVKRVSGEISELVEREENPPSGAQINRKIRGLKDAWKDFCDAHLLLATFLSPEQMVGEDNLFVTTKKLCDDAEDKAIDYLDALVAPVVEAVRDNSSIVADLVTEQEVIFTTVKDTIQEVEIYIAQLEEGEPAAYTAAALKLQGEMLEGALAQLETASAKRDKIVQLDPTKGESQRKVLSENAISAQAKVRSAKIRLNKLGDGVAGGSVVSSVAATSSHSFKMGAAYHTRQPYPKFDGERRNFPVFKKDWLATVAPHYDDAHQIRELRRSVPKYLEPEIKNMRSMSEAWEFLVEEFGKPMEAVADIVNELYDFKISRNAKSEPEQFMELYRGWTKAVNDLIELNNLRALEHEPTLDKIIKKLPSPEARARYVQFTVNPRNVGKTAFQVAHEFMEEERRMMRRLTRIEGNLLSEERGAAKKTEDKDKSEKFSSKNKKSGACYNCGEVGHLMSECKAKRKSHNTQVSPAKPCPACQENHTWRMKDGSEKNSTRLSSCPVFRNKSANERAGIISQAQGCVLCLDWSGNHRRDSCEAKVKGQKPSSCTMKSNGVVCGIHHHEMLHGTTQRYCNAITRGDLERGVPEAVVHEEEGAVHALMQVQSVEVAGAPRLGVIFWDNGSNVNMIRKAFAEEIGLNGKPAKHFLKTTGEPSKEWNTVTYEVGLVDRFGNTHYVIAMEMEHMTAAQPEVDLGCITEVFPGINPDDVKRPVGEVDMLLGIHVGGIHPTVSPENVVGELRLCHSLFGSGFLLDGSHPEIKIKDGYDVHWLHSAYNLSRNPQLGLVQGRYQRTSRSCHRTQVIRASKSFSFMECEEMATLPPKRCGNCMNCKKCSIRAQEISRKDAEELTLIEANLKLDPERKKLTFRYPLIKDPAEALSDNRRQAIGLSKGLEHRLRKDGTLEQYNEQLRDYIERGVIREMSEKEIQDWDGAVNYIGHHPVFKPDSATTKMRIVANSSLNNNHGGTSYNDCMVKGPNTLVPLFSALVNFRSYVLVVSWDLAKAYNQVETGKAEFHCRRIVWRWGESDKVWSTFGFLVMTFGDRCAAAALESGKRLGAEFGENICPETAAMISQSYVDDGSGGGSEAMVNKLIGEEKVVDGVMQYTGTVAQILDLVGFRCKVMVRSGESRPEIINKLGGGVLGIPWDPTADNLMLKMEVNLNPKKDKVHLGPALTEYNVVEELASVKITRRLMLSQIYAVYDPLGILVPLTIKLKLVLQELAEDSSKDNWDEEVDGELREKCVGALSLMVLAPDVVIPRSIIPKDSGEDYDLVTWCDGGSPAFCGCVYTRCVQGDLDVDEGELRLLSAKARVKPKTIRKSTPRMELAGSVLLHRLITAVLPGLSKKPRKIWRLADSQCTISAIEADGKILGIWFANRVEEIGEHARSWEEMGINVMPMLHWPGLTNPADLGTKGQATIEDMRPGGAWLAGPAAARLPTDQWPASSEFKRAVPQEELLPRVAQVFSTLLQQGQWGSLMEIRELMERVSKYKTVLGSIGRIVQAQKELNRAAVFKEPTPAALRSAERLVYLLASMETHEWVQAGKLSGLDSFMEDGLWKTMGRFRKGIHSILGVSSLPILRPDSRLALLLIKESHEENHEGGKLTLWRTRHKAWIVRGRRPAEKIAKECVKCKARYAKKCEQKIGDIVPERMAYGRPTFSCVSLDFTGPTLVKPVGKARAQVKTWTIVFVCMTTGALHLELVDSYGTEAFLLAWEAFVSLRGRPSRVVSDQGSQLILAQSLVSVNKEESPDAWGWDEIIKATGRKGTEWTLVEPGCQWRNGLAESRVKILKQTLDHLLVSTLVNSKPTLHFTELRVLLLRIANIVNDRPIGVRNINNEDMVPLTVNQLLQGRTSTTNPPVVSEEEDEPSAVQLTGYVEELSTTWWNLYRAQGFSSLLPYQRLKDSKRHKNLQVGDICLLNYESKIRGKYRVCRVLKIKKSSDELVRTVTVGLRDRRKTFTDPKNIRKYFPAPLAELQVGVGRLVLLVPVEEQSEENKNKEVDSCDAEMPEYEVVDKGEDSLKMILKKTTL